MYWNFSILFGIVHEEDFPIKSSYYLMLQKYHLACVSLVLLELYSEPSVIFNEVMQKDCPSNKVY